MAITVDTLTYRVDSQDGARVVYAGSGHSVSHRDVLQLSRIDPKATKDSAGQARAEARTQRTAVSAAAAIIGINTISTGSSIAVGTPETAIDSLIAAHRAFIASPHFVALVKQGITRMDS